MACCAPRSRATSSARTPISAYCTRCAASGARARDISSASPGTKRSDTIATRFGDLAASADGPQSILPYSYAGTMGLLQYASMDRRFFHRLGASLLDRTICASAGKAGWTAAIGASVGMDFEQYENSRLIIIWGSNPDRVEPALLDARAGSEAARRQADRDRSLSQRHRGKMPAARRADARHRRGAGAGAHARADRAGSARP